MKNLEEIMEDEMMTVKEIREKLDRTEKDKIRQSLQNCRYVLEHDPLLKGAIQRNDLTCQIDITKEVPWKRRDVHMTDTDMNNLTYYLEENYGLVSDRAISKTVDIVANDHSFNPIIDHLESLKWDGIPRIANVLTHFFGVERNAYSEEVMKMHMLAAIQRLYNPGCKYDIMLCLVGGQGTGKSTFFNYLAMRDEWFTDGLSRLDDKKVYEVLQGHWIIEMAEMDAVASAKSIEETKAFISRQKDNYRIPYERRSEDRLRQCVFCGTSNDMAFLPLDRTGNRRFAPVKTNPDKAEVRIYENEKESRQYITQMWAEAMEIYREGNFALTFTAEMEEYVKTLQKEFMPEDTKAGMIQSFLDDYDGNYICTAILYQKVLHGNGIPQKWVSKEIGDILENSIVGWSKHGNHRFGGELGTQRSWKRDCPKQSTDGFEPVYEQEEIPFL